MNKYIPSKIVVGRLKYNSNDVVYPSFLVCKYKNKWWTNDSLFKFLVGYTRFDDSKCSNNIERDVSGAMLEFQNDPIVGLKIPNRTRVNLYYEKYWDHVYILEDPRGFSFAVDYGTLNNIISKSRIVNGIIQDKIVYAMPNSDVENVAKRFIMGVEIVDESVEADIEESRKFDIELEYSKQKITGSNLKIGTVYVIDKKKRDDLRNCIYVGNIKMFKPRDFSGCHLERFLSRSKNMFSFYARNIDSYTMPWNNDSYKEFYNSAKSSEMHVFIDVEALSTIDEMNLDDSNMDSKCLRLLRNSNFFKGSSNKVNDAFYKVIIRNPSMNSIKGVLKEKDVEMLAKARKFIDRYMNIGNKYLEEIKRNFPVSRPTSQTQFNEWVNSKYSFLF